MNMNEEQWPALPTQLNNPLPSSTSVPVVPSVWNKGLTKPAKVDSPAPAAGKNEAPESRANAKVDEAKVEAKEVVKNTNTDTNTALETDKEHSDTPQPKPKDGKTVSKKERKSTKPEAVAKEKDAFHKPRGKKNRKFVPLAVDEEVAEVAEDKESTNKTVPRKNNAKFELRDAKVPKTRPPRSEGDGYYSGYYVCGSKSGERERVWVWVEA
ncbi:hypothetical protein B0T20DRAFT_493044 [Sordaria brevicollis]|uniref:Uncharacterized protein n=1 Tax=Sordaria brevicollis TaxID=83679 RepID=A0AAE0UFZ0_SORBR|nr:hypothetical protein B0T20DRAFT_493044 [Sordaria brevicollis]